MLKSYFCTIPMLPFILALATSFAWADQVVVDNLTGYGNTSYRSDAGYGGPNNGFINSAPLQRFDASIGGTVTTVTTLVGNFDGVETEPLTVWILNVNGSLPGSTLGMLTVPANQIAKSMWTETTFDFSSQGVQLQAGQSYFVGFTVDKPVVSGFRYGFPHVWTSGHILGYAEMDGLNKFQGGYIGGGPTSSAIGEMALRVSVVPEPGTFCLFIAGLLAWTRRTAR